MIAIDAAGLADLAFALVGAAAAMGGLVLVGFLILAVAVEGRTRFEREKFETEREEQRQALDRIRAIHVAHPQPARFSPQEAPPCAAQLSSLS